MKAQPGQDVGHDYQIFDTLPHPDHFEVAADPWSGPNLVLWTGNEHRLVLQLKDDAKEAAL